jgi:hypothetical protein
MENRQRSASQARQSNNSPTALPSIVQANLTRESVKYCESPDSEIVTDEYSPAGTVPEIHE